MVIDSDRMIDRLEDQLWSHLWHQRLYAQSGGHLCLHRLHDQLFGQLGEQFVNQLWRRLKENDD